jgi:Arc/MetJ-type ribon-helix-helix transcriptional regulator
METSERIIVKEITDRLDYLIGEGRYEDAIAIGEEFDEWIRNLVN